MIGRWIERSGFNSRWAFVSLVTLIYWMGPQSVRLFYPLHLQNLGASNLVIGLGVGTSSLAGLLLAIPSGYLLDRFNYKRPLIATTLGLALTTGAFVWASSVTITVVLMFLQGLFQMWVWLILQAMITQVGTSKAAGRQLALFSVAWGIGLAAGPSVGAWIYDSWGFETVSVVCLLFSLIGTAGAFFVPRALAQVEHSDNDGAIALPQGGMLGALRRSFGNSVVVGVMVSSLINSYVQSLRLSFYPVFLTQSGVSVPTIGYLLSMIGVSSLAVRVLLPLLIRNFGMVKPLLWSTCIAIIGVSMTPVTTNILILMLGAIMIGAGLGANPPITVNLLASSQDQDHGVAVGLRMFANRSAQVVQPLVFGGTAAVAGLAIAFPASGLLLCVAVVWMAKRLRGIDEA